MTRPNRPSMAVTILEDRSTPAAVGSLDPTFANGGRAVFNFGSADTFNAIGTQSDGKVIVAGSNGSGDMVVARVLVNGSLDPTFGTNGVRYIDYGGNDVATSLFVQADNRIVIGGYSESNGQADIAVARLLKDGANDGSFNGGGQRLVDLGRTDKANAVTLNSAGAIYLAGSTGTDVSLTRLDQFGNIDRGFGTQNGTVVLNYGGTEVATSVALVPDGRPVLSGYTNARGTNDFFATRIASDGAGVDFGFGTALLNNNKVALFDTGGDDKAYAAALQPDGNLIVVGTDGGPASDFLLARFNPAGGLDPLFNNGAGFRFIGIGGTDEARAVTVAADGKILVAGFTTPDRSADGNFAVTRLLSNGSDDPAFGGVQKIDFGGNDRAYGVAITPAGRIVLAGQVTADAGASRNLGNLGTSSVLLTGGPANGTGRQFIPQNGSYIAGPDFNVFPGGNTNIRVTAGDVNGDGVDDRIAAAGPGGGPIVAIYDGKTGGLLAQFFAFEPDFRGGLLVAAGDFDGDGKADIVVTADTGGGPRVRVFDGANISTNNIALQADFLAINDPAFRGGARPAIGDINGDGIPDLVIAAGPGGGPRIAIYDGKTIGPGKTPTNLVADFFAFEPTLRNGAFPAVGDLDGDGFADLFFAAGPGGAPRIRAISGKQLLAAGPFQSLDQIVGAQLANFVAGSADTRGGTTIAVKDIDGDEKADLVVGSGLGLRSEVRIYKGKSILANTANPNPDQIIDPYNAELPTGVFVG